MFRKLLLSFMLVCGTSAVAQTRWVDTPFGQLPAKVYYATGKHHVQGVAVDTQNKCIYFSFTTCLVKTDYEGRLLGSVVGLTCHLGCLDLDTETGLLYGSMEYKNDVIGQGISGKDAMERPNSFYVGIFDTRQINRIGIPATDGKVLKGVFLQEVVDMYEGKTVNKGKECEHIYGCSGIDGVSVGPQFGKQGGKKVINVALGIYGDTHRSDNDYQVLLQYDLAQLSAHAQPFTSFHRSGPTQAKKRYFAFTGNTTWGVQNMEYDSFTGYWFLGVYKGKKPEYPNYALFAIDGKKPARKQVLQGFDKKEKGLVLTMAEDGLKDPATGIRGWNFRADTGIESLGKGYFYVSESGKTQEKVQYCNLRLYRWTGNAEKPFEEVR